MAGRKPAENACRGKVSGRSITSDKSMKKFEKNVSDTIKKYSLFSKNDKVLVACSGGKDSTVALYILKKLGYDAEAITVDSAIGKYTKENLENLRLICRDIGVKLHEISLRDEFGMSLCYIRSVLNSKGHPLKSCTICGVLRRYLLNREAKKINPDVIVTGHNMDDEAQSVMMNLFRGNLGFSARLGPKSGVGHNKNFVQRVKPLYFCSEKEVTDYCKKLGYKIEYGECPCSSDAYRREIKKMFLSMGSREKIKENIIRSFIGILPKLKQYYNKGEVNICSRCGEPTNKDVCNACIILGKLKD